MYSTEQSPWEANRFAASQEIPRILWKPKAHYRTHKCPLALPILSNNPISHFLEIKLYIVLPSTPRSPKWFLHQNSVYASHLLHTRHMSRPSHSFRIYHPKNTLLDMNSQSEYKRTCNKNSYGIHLLLLSTGHTTCRKNDLNFSQNEG